MKYPSACRRSLSAVAALMAVLGTVQVACAQQEPLQLTLKVSAGAYDRRNTPVAVPVLLPNYLRNATSVVVLDGKGASLQGQLTAPSIAAAVQESPNAASLRTLHFILPDLESKQVATFQAVISPASTRGPAASWTHQAGVYSEFRFGDRPILRYMNMPLDNANAAAREQTYKVFHHLYDPAGERLVTKGPGGRYTHHRGLFYGFNRVTYGDGRKHVDTWHCKGDAHLSDDGLVLEEAGPVLGRHVVKVGWHGEGQDVFARELREVTAYIVPGKQLVEFASRLETTGGMVLLDGDPQHAGFHFRADDEVAAKTAKQTYYLRPDGQDKLGATRNWDAKNRNPAAINLPWNAMSFVLGDKRYTAVYLDSPANPKEARYSERDYGRFGSYFEYTLTKEQPLVVDYRLALQEGEITIDEAAALSNDFVHPVEVEVSYPGP